MIIFIEIIAFLCLGLLLGSFASALTYRVPRNISWVSKRSACTHCKTSLKARDLIPLFSWLMTRGKCRTCAQRVSLRYPVLEGLCAVLTLATYLMSGTTADTFFIIAAMPFLLALLVIDLDEMILPNQLVMIVFSIGLVRLAYILFLSVSYGAAGGFTALVNPVSYYIFSALAYALLALGLGVLLSRILDKKALGMGDVKFFGLAGLWLGIMALPGFMILSGTMAILFALFWRYRFKQERFPFGPALITSFYLLFVFQGSFFV